MYMQVWMSEIWYMTENFHTKNSVFTAPDVHMHTSLSYIIMSRQPVNKAENIWSTPVLETRRKKRRRKKSSQCFSYKEQ